MFDVDALPTMPLVLHTALSIENAEILPIIKSGQAFTALSSYFVIQLNFRESLAVIEGSPLCNI